jgi:Asp-tRNA(Asn)/Glu-tRNA(Gln) amidotransferase A subunit family amidase
MPPSRRDFLANTTLGLLGAAIGASAQTPAPAPTQSTPGAPPAFGTASPVGPEVSPSTFAEAEKLLQIEMTPADRATAASNWRMQMAPLYERRTGPNKVALDPTLAPASQWIPILPGHPLPSRPAGSFHRTPDAHTPLPSNEEDIAFAPVWQLSRWIETRQLTSVRLTEIYLRRIERFDPRLRCIITLTRDHALAQATQADAEIARGHYRSPLHGIPFGVKDLLDTAGIPTTYGAEPFRNRIPDRDSAVVARLYAAGAVLLAKLSLGALALNDIWFGGQTMNPWLLEEGASGSSAGPGASVASGLVAFAIGSETGGSIVSPSMRCGVTGLRPTYGLVPRTGAMTLCWSLDKLGPMTRSVEDAILVLNEILGPDPGDLASLTAGLGGPNLHGDSSGSAASSDHSPSLLSFNPAASLSGLRVGYFPAWMQQAPATDVDRSALQAVKKLGMTAVEVSLPTLPYDSLNLILFAEGAAAFEEITLDHRVDQLKAQVPDAWPNVFRQARFLSAVDFVQTDRLRRRVAEEMARLFAQVDLLLVPSLRDEMLVISNNTGHPSLTLRAGFVEVSEARSDWAPDPANPLPKFSPPRRVPHGVTLIGPLFGEGVLCQAGLALEKEFAVSQARPSGF